jgi:pyruvate dehydrogenase E2 component (dihydrolipoamide acetyltransferase)
MSTFNLPDLGEGLKEAEIVAWHVAAGDHVVADQPLVSIETDKAVVEVPSPQSGRIEKLFGEPGDIVEVGAPLVAFEEGAHADAGTVVGSIETEPKEKPAPRPAASGKVKAAPAVRALAGKLGVDLSSLQGSGPDGAIAKADVEQAASGEGGAQEPLRGVRRAMAEKMAQAHAEVVPANVTGDADIHGWPEGTEVMIRLIRAMAAAARTEPALNAWFDGKRLSRRLHEQIDLGIAVDTEDGLFVPVLRDAGNKSADDLRQALEDLRDGVAKRSLPPRDLSGQTITLSNFGAMGGRYAAMVVVPPQVAILGAGRAEPRVVAASGEPAVHRVLPLSLTFDHRAVTGGEATRFLAAVITDLEKET